MGQASGNLVNNNSSGLGIGNAVNGLVNLGKEAYAGASSFLKSPLFTGNNMFGTPGQSSAATIGNGLSGLIPPPSSNAVGSNNNTYSLNGQSYNAAGNPIGNSPASNTVAPNASAPQPSVYQQNLSRYGLSSIPNGYSFNANGKLTNAAGQEYAASSGGTAAPTTTPPQTGSTGLGTGGGLAPAGRIYNGQGQLVPIDNTQTVNSQGQNTPISTNVATGGGTQTNFPSLVGGLASTAASQSPEYQAAVQDYNQQKAALQNIQSQFGTQFGNTLNERTNIAEAQGEQGAIANAEALQEAPLTQRMQADTALLGAATAQQGTQQSGLQGAAGLVSPQAANIYGTYNPLNPTQYTGYGGGGTGSGAATAGGVGTQVQQGAAVQQMTGTQAQAQALTKNLGDLITSADINPNNASVFTGFLNGVNQWLNTQSGDPQYQNFANLINEISSRYASILNQSGGTPTDQSTISHSIINGLASGKDIQTVLASLDKNATDSINALKQSSQGNAAASTGSSGSSGSSVSAGGYNYVQQNGKWIVQQ